MILVRKRTETGWWQGEIQASGTGTKGRKRQIGWFPASYVKLLGGGGGASEKPAEKTEEKEEIAKKPQYRALYTYAGQHDDELAFNAGDIISLISKDEEAWWKGELDGRVGVFPSNYVEELNCKYFYFYTLGQNPTFYPEIPQNLMFENVNFVKNEILNM